MYNEFGKIIIEFVTSDSPHYNTIREIVDAFETTGSVSPGPPK